MKKHLGTTRFQPGKKPLEFWSRSISMRDIVPIKVEVAEIVKVAKVVEAKVVDNTAEAVVAVGTAHPIGAKHQLSQAFAEINQYRPWFL